ncbi:cupin domain-containing protein [Amphritea atlantica]|uniref:Cupin domain-containing protein n=1 Tax=Amphritea atlantica TaxID=355243 RepID=A0ABY5GYK5_9GAMM|nr:cupin domain-containing protein [Amphritea atlantica]
MNALGTLDDLPQSYRDRLTELNLVPLWPSMRAVLPYNVPTRKTDTQLWAFGQLRPLLIEAGDLTPMEKAERRVLVLSNPGHGLTNMQATPSIYMGLQLILKNETAPNHRHTPNAVRIIVEGEGASTIVDGEPCIMERGDLILTPSGKWHEHRHDGEDPIIWLDILDLPLIYQLEGSWAIEGAPQTLSCERDKSFAEYSSAGVVPEIDFQRESQDSPMLRYPWAKTRSCLLEMAQHYDSGLLRIAYVNPENGASLFPSIGFGAIMLRPGETINLPKRTSACVFHIVEGMGALEVDCQDRKAWQERDTLCAPGYSDIVLQNLSETTPAFLITADDAPLHRYLGIY